MSKPRVGLITFGDPRDHEYNNFFKRYAEPKYFDGIEYFSSLPIDLVYGEKVACTIQDIDEQVDMLKKAGVESYIAYNPCWSWPNMVVRSVIALDLPTVLVTNCDPGTHGTVGLLGIGGTLSQIGKPHIRIRADFGDKVFEEKMMPYLQAAQVASKLKGEIFGMFGGRSLGIDTGVHDPMQWKAKFGIDTDHIDQLEIIRQADMIDEDRVEKMTKWLVESVSKVSYNEKLTSDKLKYQVRCYLATKDIIEQRNLSFLSVKCMPDLTNNYVPQCLSAAFLPYSYDGEGPKKPIAMSCEADADAALTMEMLKIISGDAATMFADVSHMAPEKNLLYLPNCGGMTAWFANRSDDPAENMKKIELRPANRPAGGASTFMMAAPGEITLARLYRVKGQYKMAIIPGEVITPDAETLDEFVKSRGSHQLPTAYVKVSFDFDEFVDEFGSNHIVGVGGIYEKELVSVCEMLDITPVVMK
ncbi:L-fucose/L-arabinose isomerase family protein [Clostridium sediminicola]|uniref:L-fucose/L-arabinose isomerase family protein n=1 Tax=Clostridium sediminicola TaxID=3114879 RepID=UPI0031F20F73